MIAGECNADVNQLFMIFVTLREEASLRTAHICGFSGWPSMGFLQKLYAQPPCFNSMSEM